MSDIISKVLRLMLAVCLVVGLAPNIALAAEAPQAEPAASVSNNAPPSDGEAAAQVEDAQEGVVQDSSSSKKASSRSTSVSESDLTPTIKVQPQPVKCKQGDQVDDLKVQAQRPTKDPGASGTLTYQWYVSDNESLNGAYAIKGETYSSLPVDSSNEGINYYYCEVTNTYEGVSSSVNSEAVMVNITSIYEAATPQIVAQPQSFTVAYGDKPDDEMAVVAKVEGNGAGELTYQWYKSSNPDGSDAEAIDGATNNYWDPSVITDPGANYFYCVITNTFNGVTETAEIKSEIVSYIVEDTVSITNADDLIAVRDNINNNKIFYRGVTLNIENDIDLTSKDKDWTPLGSSSSLSFQGSIDGNYHKIKLESTQGGLIGYMTRGNIENLYVEGSINFSTGTNFLSYVGGVVCNLQPNEAVSFKNVISEVSVNGEFLSNFYYGGIVGYAYGYSYDLSFSGCANKGDITLENNILAGGLIGTSRSSSSHYLLIENCYNTGNISAGGSSSSYRAAGICASCDSYTEIKNSYNSGIIRHNDNSDTYTYSLINNGTSYNSYALENSAKTNVTGCKLMSENDMKETLHEKLGEDFVSSIGNYPLLKWELYRDGTPVFVKSPESAVYQSNDAIAALTVEAISMTPSAALSYQWFKRKEGQAAQAIQGATSTSYMPERIADGATYYYCEVTATLPDGRKASNKSDDAEIICLSGISAATPSIISQPESITINMQESGRTISVEASVSGQGAGKLTYQWYWASSPDLTFYWACSGDDATKATFEPYPNQMSKGQTRYYFCEITNNYEPDNTVTIRSEAAEVTVDASYYIYTVDDFINFRDYANSNGTSGTDGVKVYLMADLDLTEKEDDWAPIGSSTSNPFKGTFDGCYHTLKFRSTTGGLFAYFYGTGVKNLYLEGSMELNKAEGTLSGIGAVANYIYTTSPFEMSNVISNVKITGALYDTYRYLGGLVGYTRTTSCVFSQCANKGDISLDDGRGYIGGLIGRDGNTTSSILQANNCYNSGNITAGGNSSQAHTGGIIGYCSYGILETTNCYNSGKITNKGSIISYTYDFGSSIKNMSNCYSFNECGAYNLDPRAISVSSAEMESLADRLGPAYENVDGAFPKLYFEGRADAYVQTNMEDLYYSVGDNALAWTAELKMTNPAYAIEDSSVEYRWYASEDEQVDPEDTLVGTESSFTPSTENPSTTFYYCVGFLNHKDSYGFEKSDPFFSSFSKVEVGDASASPVSILQKVNGEDKESTTVDIYDSVNIDLEANFLNPSLYTGELSFQWYKAASADMSDAAAIEGAKASSISIETTSLDDIYLYCDVRNGLSLSVTKTPTVKISSVEPIISSLADLESLRDKVNKGYQYEDITVNQTCDIDMSSVYGEGKESWIPIGSSSSLKCFRGTYDGNGHRIDGLYIADDFDTSLRYRGLFGISYYGSFKNLTVSGHVGANYSLANVAGVCGDGTYNTFENVVNECSVSAVKCGYAAGVANAVATFKNCSNKGEVKVFAAYGAAGITSNSNTTITTIDNCYNLGNITNTYSSSSARAQGISYGASRVYGCYNAGIISASTYVYPIAQSVPGQNGAGNFALEGDYPSVDPSSSTYAPFSFVSEFEICSPSVVDAMNRAVGGNAFIASAPLPTLFFEAEDGTPVVSSCVNLDASYVQGDRPSKISVDASCPEGVEGAISYQWYMTDDKKLMDVTPIDGETSNTYLAQTSQMPVGVNYVFCLVTNTTNERSISIKTCLSRYVITSTIEAAEPKIALQPKSAMYNNGLTNKAQPLTVGLAYENGPGLGEFSFQWYRSDSSNLLGAMPIAGANESTYTPDISLIGSVYYYCLITNVFEGIKYASAYSDVAEIVSFNDECAAPQIQTYSAGNIIFVQHELNDDTFIKVDASLPISKPANSGELSIKWYKSNNANGLNPQEVMNKSEDPFIFDVSDDVNESSESVLYYFGIVTNSFYDGSTINAVTAQTDILHVDVVSRVPAAYPVSKIISEERDYIQGDSAQPLIVRLESFSNSELDSGQTTSEGIGVVKGQWYRSKDDSTESLDDDIAVGSAFTVNATGENCPLEFSQALATTGYDGTWYFYCKFSNTFERVKTVEKASTTVRVSIEPKYHIYSREDFESFMNMIGTSVNGAIFTGAGYTVALHNDIDLGGESSPYTLFYKTTSYAFKGIFEGNGHTISGMYINYTGTSSTYKYMSLFGNTSSATIRNLIVEGDIIPNIAQPFQDTIVYMGGIVGYSLSTTFENCKSYVNITMANTGGGASSSTRTHGFGGIVGYMSGGAVTNCSYEGEIITHTAVSRRIFAAGGIAGNIGKAAIDSCYAKGSIYGNRVGGIVGNFSASGSSISNSYFEGMCGNYTTWSENKTPGAISSGQDAYSCSYSNNYYNSDKMSIDCGAQSDPDNNVGLSEASMKTKSFADMLNNGIERYVAQTGATPLLIWETQEKPMASPVITEEIGSNQIVFPEETPTSFSVIAILPNNAEGVLSYQWFSGNAPYSKDAVAIPNAISSTLNPSIDDIEPDEKKYYWCEVTNSLNGKTAIAKSTPYYIWIKSSTLASTPVITTQPQSKSYAYNQSMTTADYLTVGIDETKLINSDGGVAYQWYKTNDPDNIPHNLEDLDSSLWKSQAIQNATTYRYINTSFAKGAAGKQYYFCVVTNTYQGYKKAMAVSDVACIDVADEIIVKTAAEFQALRGSAGPTYEGVTIKIANDLTISSWTSYSIGYSASYPFKGTIDGQGHTVAITMTNYIYPVFKYVEDAEIKNLVIDAKLTSTYYPGCMFVANATGSEFMNVGFDFYFALTNENIRNWSGFVGNVYPSKTGIRENKYINCYANSTISNVYTKYSNNILFGGFAGTIAEGSNATFEGCYASGTYELQYHGSSTLKIGSFAQDTSSDTIIKSCYGETNINSLSGINGNSVAVTSIINKHEDTKVNNSYWDAKVPENNDHFIQTDDDIPLFETLESQGLTKAAALNKDGVTAFIDGEDGDNPRLIWQSAKAVGFESLIEDQKYTGAPITPNVVVTKNGAVVDNSSYDVVFTNNVEIGIAYAYVVFDDGSVFYSNFNIIGEDFSGAICDPIPTQAYTSAPVCPNNDVVVRLNNEILKEGKDYQLIYTNNVNVGFANVEISGLGLYKGQSIQAQFMIDGELDSVVEISSAEELEQLSNDVANGLITEGRTFLLTKDIDLSTVCGTDIADKEISWKPIGIAPSGSTSTDSSMVFKGVFDGQGHRISNIYTSKSTNDAALFGYTLGATIKNLTVDGHIHGSSMAAGIVAHPWKTTLKCLVNEANITGEKYIGGIAGEVGTNTSTRVDVSGLTEISNCANKGSLNATYISPDYSNPIAGTVGGIVGSLGTENACPVTIENCYNAGDLTGRYIGGIFGYYYYIHASYIQNVANCYNVGRFFANCSMSTAWTGPLTYAEPTGSYSFGTISNNYYLENNVEYLFYDESSDTDCYEYVPNGVIVQTSDQMKSNNLVDLLNQGGKTNYVPVENDYPRLAFEDAVYASENDITITGIKDMPWTGDAIEFDGITVRDNDGDLVEGDDYTVEYSDNTDMGTASIAFNFKGKYYETITKYFEITNPTISVDELEVSEIAAQMYKGAPVMPEVAVTYVTPNGKKIGLQQAIDYNLSYEDNDAPGTASVKITGIDKFASTKTIEFDINSISLGDGENLSEDVTAEIYGSWFYTGKEIRPVPVVKYGDETLTAGTDFTCTYENNVEIGTNASITVTASGYYVGSFKLEFEIQKPSFGGEGSSVTIDPIEPQQFTGDQICPEVTFRVNGEEVSGEAFEISYGENVNVSTGGSITITANDKELYGEGSITSSFQILPLDFTDIVEVVEVTAEEDAYTGEPIYVSDIKAKVNDKELEYGTDYEVDPLGYENNINAGEATVTIVGTGNYTGTAKGTYIINKADASEAVVNADAATYTGSAVEPAGHVTFNGEDVTDSFTFAYENNVNAGNATIRAIPNEDCNFDPDTYTSQIFVIEKANGPVVRGVAMTSETIEGYTKDGTIQGVTAQMEWQTSGGADAWTPIEGDAITGLSAGKYDVRYAESDNTYAGTAKTVTVSASNKQVTTLSITSASVALGSVQYGATAAKSAVVTNAGNIRQTNIKVTSSNPAILASVNATSVDPGKTFSMTASAARANVGTYTSTVKVTSAENPTGVTFNVTLTVTAKPVANLTVAGVANKTYNGAAQTQAPAITDGSTALTLNKDYSLSYANNVNAGTATMTITGMGNYSGSRTVNFSIGAQAAAATVTLNKTQMTYTGKALAPVVTVKVGATTLTTASYTVALANNIKPGQATVKVTLKGNYTGSGSTTFKIIPKKMTIKAPVAAKKALTVKWTKDANVTGYEILVATNSGFTKNKKTVKVTKASTTSKKVTGLKAKTKYYVKIRSYKTVGSTKLYSAWSSSKNKKTK